jgi:hypothetical protein
MTRHARTRAEAIHQGLPHVLMEWWIATKVAIRESSTQQGAVPGNHRWEGRDGWPVMYKEGKWLPMERFVSPLKAEHSYSTKTVWYFWAIIFHLQFLCQVVGTTLSCKYWRLVLCPPSVNVTHINKNSWIICKIIESIVFFLRVRMFAKWTCRADSTTIILSAVRTTQNCMSNKHQFWERDWRSLCVLFH